jgi:hypothetical protein
MTLSGKADADSLIRTGEGGVGPSQASVTAPAPDFTPGPLAAQSIMVP